MLELGAFSSPSQPRINWFALQSQHAEKMFGAKVLLPEPDTPMSTTNERSGMVRFTLSFFAGKGGRPTKNKLLLR